MTRIHVIQLIKSPADNSTEELDFLTKKLCEMKSTNNFAVRFILRHTNKNLPEAVIYARIIVDKKRVEISLNKLIDPGFWNGEKQSAFGSKELVNRINPYIDEVRFKLNDCYRQLKMQDTFITAEEIKSLFVG